MSIAGTVASTIAGAAAGQKGALARRKLGGSTASGAAPPATPDASRVAAKLPGLRGFRLGAGAPAAPAGDPGFNGGNSPEMERYFADRVGRKATPVGSEAAIQDFAAQNPGLTEDFIRNAAGGPPAPPPEVQGRALNPDGTSITGRGGNVQQLGPAALRRLGGGPPAPGGGSDTDMVAKRLPPGLKGFRLPPGFDPTSISTPARDMPTDEITREIDGGLKPMVADEPPMEAGPPPRRPGGARIGRRVQGY